MTRSSHQEQQRRTFKEPPSTEEISKLLAFARRKPHTRDLRDIVGIIGHTGLRPRELSDLRWEHVDLRSHSIPVVSDKSGATRRVPFTRKTAMIFRRRLQHQPRTDHVFGVAPRSVLLRVSRQLRTFAAQLGIRPFSLYSLRHAFASRLANSGGNAFLLACILGNRSFSTMMRRFILPSEQPRIAEQQLEVVESQAS